MNYESSLKIVKQQFPDMPFKEQQRKASEMYKEFKLSQNALATGDLPYATRPDLNSDEESTSEASRNNPDAVPVKRVTMAELINAEKKIKAGTIDVNAIISIGREVLPEGRLVNHGKAAGGVNSRVTFEDNKGNKIPIVGEFQVFFVG
jgi:hypothetical protein